MEDLMLKITSGGISAQNLIMLIQLVSAGFLFLWIKEWVKSTWAFYKFKKSIVLGLGSKVGVTVNGAKYFEGEITSVSKSNIIITHEKDTSIVIKTSKFMGGDYDWVIFI